MPQDNFCIGIDYGTDSVRTLIVDAANGNVVASAVFHYPVWADGRYSNASLHQFRQHPRDYIEGLETTVGRCLREAGPAVRANIRAISVDTTGSSPIAVDRKGRPLSLQTDLMTDPDAMFILWKDHTAGDEAEEINAHAKRSGVDYMKYAGGVYSSEWYWAKLLHILRKNAAVRDHCYAFVEHCDWMPFLLTGGTDADRIKRSVCAAGHKALWSRDWGGFPPDGFFSSLDPLLAGFAARLPQQTYTADQIAGKISLSWAARLGLDPGVLVGIGAMDAHMGAVGGQIEPYHMSKVMGTSTCDMLVAPGGDMQGKCIRGICGMVEGSIIPGMTGMEAGQSAFGDAYAWFRDLLAWPLKQLQMDSAAAREAMEKIIPELSRQAAQLPLEENSELSLDWFNGRRSPDADALVKAGIANLNLGTDAPKIFRALVEGTCFGARAIVETFTSQDVPVKGLIGIGGIARKSPFVMQMLADTLGMPIRINRSEQTCALGAAMFAATAAGLYEKVEDAMQAMGHGFDVKYYPDRTAAGLIGLRYEKYLALGRFAGRQLQD
jgi:L-ribulokinase